MAAVVWRYPEDELARLSAQASELAEQQKVSAPVVSLDALNFQYTIQVIKGAPAWTPVQAFDDGRRTFVRFPPAMLVREAPALFVLRDKEIQLVNYRVKGDTYVIDRLIDSAELRVGQQDQEIVRILRGIVPPPQPTSRPIHGR
jgi:type IV secretion system protein VirB9